MFQKVRTHIAITIQSTARFLRRTTYDIEMLSVDEAEDYEYEPCGLCLKESVREQWDDAAGVVFIPVSCLLFGLINKIDQFNKKYKLRNPIVKR